MKRETHRPGDTCGHLHVMGSCVLCKRAILNTVKEVSCTSVSLKMKNNLNNNRKCKEPRRNAKLCKKKTRGLLHNQRLIENKSQLIYS